MNDNPPAQIKATMAAGLGGIAHLLDADGDSAEDANAELQHALDLHLGRHVMDAL